MYPTISGSQCLYIKTKFRNNKAAAKKQDERPHDDGMSPIEDSSEPACPLVPMNDQGTTHPSPLSQFIAAGVCPPVELSSPSNPASVDASGNGNGNVNAGEFMECKSDVLKMYCLPAGGMTNYSALDSYILIHQDRPSVQRELMKKPSAELQEKGDKFSQMEKDLFQFMKDSPNQQRIYRPGKKSKGKISWQKFGSAWKTNLKILQIKSYHPEFHYAEPVFALRTADQLKERNKTTQN